MIEHTSQVLGFHSLLDIVSRYASCLLGQSDCLSLKPSNDKDLIDNELRLVSEMRLLLKVKGFAPLSDLNDISPLLKKSRAERSYLQPKELLHIRRLVEVCRQSKKHLASERALIPRLFGLVKDIPGFDDLIQALKDTVSYYGVIKDSASPVLKKIREKKIRLRSDIQKKLENIQKASGLPGDGQDHLVTVRDGRYVIFLRTDLKSRIEGIIHDYSRTRATCFLEPVEAIQDNNRITELSQAERAEEIRILTGLTGLVRDLAADLECSQAVVGKLDGLYARARFSEIFSCVMPEICQEDIVELKGARNPILVAQALDSMNRDEKVELPVPVDIVLDENQNVLIISGPNRGGKTVTLKTLGLLSLMAQSGIHIPAEEGSRLCVFDQIMADIGDDQDIHSGLSTFSAHAVYLKYIIEHTKKKSLVIIDEPGMGTDPDEGVALTMAVLDFLSGYGALVAVSTHLNRLKTYGLLNKRAGNASVEFDTEKNCPTFRLKYGVPGMSHALEIAEDIGIPSSIVGQAKGYIDQDEVRLNRLIEKLNNLVAEANRKKAEAEEAKERYLSSEKNMHDRLALLEAEKKAITEAKRLEAETAIEKAREDLRQAINLLKTKKESVQAYVTDRYTEVSRRLMEYFEPDKNEKHTTDPKEIKTGCPVYHKKLRQIGFVRSVDPVAGRAEVLLGKLKIIAEIGDLKALDEVPETGLDEGKNTVSWELKEDYAKEVNVIGYRVEDALPLIDKAIDRALVKGELRLRVIHGFGTGTLKDAIRSHLNESPFVRSVCSDDPRSGGDAITVVELS
jgi:DNA mismatch repair protein MutS2